MAIPCQWQAPESKATCLCVRTRVFQIFQNERKPSIVHANCLANIFNWGQIPIIFLACWLFKNKGHIKKDSNMSSNIKGFQVI